MLDKQKVKEIVTEIYPEITGWEFDFLVEEVMNEWGHTDDPHRAIKVAWGDIQTEWAGERHLLDMQGDFFEE
jgi:hypothetical protein